MKELYEKYVGKEGAVRVGGLQVNVKILDVKRSYGQERYLVTPLNGVGEIWTEQDPTKVGIPL